MKKAILCICFLVLLLVALFLFRPTTTALYSEIPILSEDQFSVLMSQRSETLADVLDLTVYGTSVSCDAPNSRTWCLPRLTDALQFTLPKGYSLVRTPMVHDPAHGKSCTLLLYNSKHCLRYRLTESDLAQCRLEVYHADSADLPSMHYGNLTLLYTENNELRMEQIPVTVKERGVTSRAYEKKGYTLSFLDDSGQSTKRSILGMPADTKIGLNSLYEDDSKIRDAFCMHLWSDLQGDLFYDSGLAFQFAELYFNGSYHGLYGIQQLITPDALHLDAEDVCFKFPGYLQTKYQLQEVQHIEIINGTEDDRSKIYTLLSDLWYPSDNDAFSVCPLYADGFARFALMVEVCAAVDNDTRNLVFVHKAAADVFYPVIWDFDQTLGLGWNSNSRPTYMSTRMKYAQNRMIGFSESLHRFLPSALERYGEVLTEPMKATYRALRQTLFSDEALLNRANSLYDFLTDCGARQRDAERWPDSAISEDNSFIEAFIPARMAFLDEAFTLGH